MADQPIIKDGLRNETFRGLRIDGTAHAVDLTNSSNILFIDCVFTNLLRTAVALQRCDKITFQNVVVHGAALSVWDQHSLNCFNIKNSGNLVWESCDIARAAHECIALLDGVAGAEYLLRDTKFGYLQPQWDGSDTRNNGGSGITIARDVDNVQILGCSFKGMPDGWESVAAHRVHHRGCQLHGRKGKVLNCLFEECGGGIKLSSGGGQVANGWLIEDTIIRDCALKDTPPETGSTPGIAIELQAMDGLGTVSGNIFRRVQVWSAQQLLHLACVGLPANLDGNTFIDCEWGSGGFFVTGQSIRTGEDLNGHGQSTGNKTISAPPTPTPVPPDPGPGPGPGPGPSGPQLTAINPSSGQAGDPVTFTGSGLGAARGWVIWKAAVTPQTPEGLVRTTPASWSDVSAVAAVPTQAITGPVFLRRADRVATNSLPFTVGTTPPPQPQPQPPPAPVAVNSPRIAAAPASIAHGQEMILQGQDFGTVADTVTIAALPHRGASIISWAPMEVHVTVGPTTPTGAAVHVNLRRPDSLTSNTIPLAVTSGPQPPQPQPPQPPSNVFKALGSPTDQASLLAPLARIFFPWDRLMPGLAAWGFTAITLEFYDLNARAFVVMPGNHRVTQYSNESGDHEHATWGDSIPGLPEETRRAVAGTASPGRIRVDQSYRGNQRVIDAIISAEIAHEVAEWHFATEAMRDALNVLLHGGAPDHEWWWGNYNVDYWGQPGESFMAGFGLAYTDFTQPDTRFTHVFTAAMAPQIRQILGAPKTG